MHSACHITLVYRRVKINVKVVVYYLSSPVIACSLSMLSICRLEKNVSHSVDRGENKRFLRPGTGSRRTFPYPREPENTGFFC